jgi:hypothetical protein
MSTTEKIDLRKLHKNEYVQPKKPAFLDVAPARYLAIKGAGQPGGPEFQDRIGALYAMAYTIKMTHKFAGEQDYTVGLLEARYWLADGSCRFQTAPPEQWRWQLMIRTPEFVTEEERAKAIEALMEKSKTPSVRDVVFKSLAEGKCVQMLHVGPYDRESDTIAVMREFANSQGFELKGPHHEMYISDPRRVAPEKLKTILRFPLMKKTKRLRGEEEKRRQGEVKKTVMNEESRNPGELSS